MGYIYRIQHIESKKCYIGETINAPEKRWNQHINRKNGCPVLGNAIRKYGITAFKFEVLIICFDEDRFFYEKQYIEKYNSLVPNGYNVLLGGNDSFKGHRHTDDIKSKISEFMKQKWNKPEYREKMLNYVKASNAKVDHRAKILNSEKFKLAMKEGRIGNKGSSHSNETKDKIRESVKRYYEANKSSKNIENHRKNMAKARGKPIQQFTLDNVFLNEFESISEAARQMEINKTGIQHCVNGRANTAGGYLWKFKV